MLGKQFGNYHILSLLGEGAMGVVYQARDTMGNEFALKLIRNEILGKEDIAREVRQRFMREANYSLKLVHPNIVRTFDAGEIDGILYLACEVVYGNSLEDILQKSGTFSPVQTLTVISQLLAALDEIEHMKMVHRDVKPANILIDEVGLVKLCDLGLMRSTTAERTILTKSGSFVGTPYYTSPEQIAGRTDLDIRSDLYAVGAIFYQCLAGSPPFTGSLGQVFAQHVNAEVPAIDIPGVTTDIIELIRKLMAKNPEQRPQSPKEALLKVQELISGVPGQVNPSHTMIDQDYTFSIKCSHCHKKYRVAVRFIGKTIRCKKCQKRFEITAPEEMRPQPTEFVSRETFSGDMTMDELLLTPVIDPSSPGLSRLKIVQDKYTLFVYGGKNMQIGRNGYNYEGQDICLRHRPTRGNENLIKRISGKHFQVFIDNGPWIEDLGSRSGTLVDGIRLQAHSPHKIYHSSEINVAEVLSLSLHIVKPGNTPYKIKDAGEVDNFSSAIFIERKNNGSEHSYALVPGRIRFSLNDQGQLKPDGNGNLELIYADKSLWICGSGANTGTCRRLTDHDTATIGTTRVKIERIEAQDQK